MRDQSRLYFRFLFPLCFLLCLFGSIASNAAIQAEYYVDPAKGSDTNPGNSADFAFQTVGRAQSAVRDSLMRRSIRAGDIVVYLRGGTYLLTKPLTLEPQDSGRPGTTVIYQAYKDEKPIFSGGKIVTGWTLHDQSHNIWQADMGPDDDFRQLYVNGQKASRTSSGSPAGANKDPQGYAISDPNLQNLKNQKYIEVVTSPHGWQEERLRVDSITADHIILQQPGLGIITSSEYPGYGGISRLENAYEWLTRGGSFYLDRTEHKLYYIPRGGESMDTALVEAPVLERLIYFHGSSAKPVSNIRISGITFRLCTWLEPSNGVGLVSTQANQITYNKPTPGEIGYPAPKAAIDGTGMCNVVISNCTFHDLGGDGVNIMFASKNDVISHCEFDNLSCSGIQVANTFPQVAQLPVGSPDIVSGITVADCTVHTVCYDYPGGCGIFLGYVQGCTIIHNELYDLPYTGISLGWGWTDKNELSAYRTDNLLEGNKIHNYMNSMNDGGGIYCNGYEQSGTITKNFIYDQHHAFPLIYLDDGAANWVVNQNVLQGKKNGMLWVLYKGVNEQISDNYTDTNDMRNMGDNNGASSSVKNTTLVTDDNWPPAAQAIMAAAGPRPGNNIAASKAP
jgi:hypothetical protein